MNISLPVPLKDWIEAQVEKQGYSTASEYVRDMIRREKDLQQAREVVDAELTRAIDSGKSTPMTRRDWQRIRTEGLKRAGRRK